MADMLAIVSKAIFDKARDSKKRPLVPGAIYATDGYDSKNPLFDKNLEGDLYVVTVRGKSLWLVGVLRSPKRKGGRWIAKPNTQPIADITKLVPKLVFANGKGIAIAKMAMSLQTPKVLADADVRLLRAHVGKGGAAETVEPKRVDRAAIDDAVVHALAELLGRSKDAIRKDRGRYAAFHSDDSAYELEPGWLDWRKLSLIDDDDDDDDDGETNDQIYGRMDFDFARTRFEHDSFDPRSSTDKSLRRLLTTQESSLYGAQIKSLVAEKRLDPETLYELSFEGPIRAKGTSLIDAARALFMLDTFDKRPLGPGEFSETDRTWARKLAPIEPQALREHIGIFFQTAEAARCTGACVDGRVTKQKKKSGKGRETIARWFIGEGQGACSLARLDAQDIPNVPRFEGRLLLRKRKPAASKGRKQADLLALLARHRDVRLPHMDGFRTIGDVHARLKKEGPKKFFAPLGAKKIAARDLRLIVLTNASNALLEKKAPDAAYALLEAARPSLPDSIAKIPLYNMGVALMELERYAEALEVYQHAFTAKTVSWAELAPSHLHNNLAWCAFKTGDLPLAESHCKKAIAADKHNFAAHGTAGSIAFARGKTKQALALFERAMKNGSDPDPGVEVAKLPAYRALAAKHGFAIELSDEEAAKLGPDAWAYEAAGDA